MIQSKTVRESFFLLLAFLRNTLILGLTGIIGYTVISWGTRVFPEALPDRGILVSFVVEGIAEVMPASIILAMVLSLLRYRKHPGIRLLSLFFLLSSSWLILTATAAYTPELFRKQPQFSMPKTVDEGFIHRQGSGSMYIESQSGTTLRNIIRMDPDAKPVLGFRSSADSTESIVVPGSKAFTPPAFIALIFRDVADLNAALDSPARSSQTLLAINVASLLFCLLCACLLLSLPRWPLYNGIIILFFLRLFVYLAPFLWKRGFHQVLRLFVKDSLLVYAPAAILTLMGSVFLLCIGLFTLGRKREAEKIHG